MIQSNDSMILVKKQTYLNVLPANYKDFFVFLILTEYNNEGLKTIGDEKFKT